MKRAAWILAFMLAASSCAAQLVCDNTNCVLNTTGANPTIAMEPSYGIKVEASTTVESRNYLWALWAHLVSYAMENDPRNRPGESVAVYGQAEHRGASPTWGGVFQCDVVHQAGGCHAVELDIMGNGPLPPSTGINPSMRDGIQMLVGRSMFATIPGPAQIGDAFIIVPAGGKGNEVELLRGVNFALPCTIACFLMQSGSRVGFDGGGGEATMLFDWKTGYLGFWNRAREMFAVNMSHGGIRVATVPCPASVITATGPIRSALECIAVNDGGFVPVYR